MKRHKEGKVSTPPLSLAAKMWPTPKGTPSGPDFARINRDGSGGDDLATAIARATWPTPAATDGQRGGKMTPNMTGQSLTQMVNSYPTPRCRDWKGKSPGGAHAPGGALCNALDVTGGQLNPNWVEFLMGWPTGWTAIDDMPINFYDWTYDPADTGEILRVATGIKNRVQRLKAIGNGQVPLCFAVAWMILLGTRNDS